MAKVANNLVKNAAVCWVLLADFAGLTGAGGIGGKSAGGDGNWGTDNAIKFARCSPLPPVAWPPLKWVWRLQLVDQKLRTGGELCEFMVNEFREAQGFILELLVIVILIIELVPIFRGK